MGDPAREERTLPPTPSSPATVEATAPALAEIVAVTEHVDRELTADALARMAETEDMIRAIGAGEVDAFVISDGGSDRRIFTLSTADRPYRMFVENMRDGAATVSSDGLILYANRRFGELLARPTDAIVGSPLAAFVAGGLPDGLAAIRGPDELGATIELALVNAGGDRVPVLLQSSTIDSGDQRLTCVTAMDLTGQKAQEEEIARLGRMQAQRLTDLQEAQAALTEQATHDALTGLPNRTLLVDRIDQALAQALRTGRYTAVLFVDLDRFKHVNDTNGHAAGDTVLRWVADKLVSVLRPMDTVARIGGDEFVVLAPGVQSAVGAVDMATRLIEALNGRGEEGRIGRVPASVGISLSLDGSGSAETLLGEADKAMYKAKSLGGGRAEVFDSALGLKALQRVGARQMLQLALEERRVVPYYQPIIDIPDGRVAGFEALARIVAEDASILSPAAFMAVAEDSGLVVPLGDQILETACREAASWSGPAAGRGLTIAVNLAARQFDPGDLADVVAARLAQTGLDPGRVHLEITETAIIDLHPDLLRQLRSIRDLGVEIGLDDFGTGYASLTHLRRLPLTFVKIDQSFVQGLGVDGGDDRIVAAVVDLAGHLGLRSIAEGVETEEQLARLRVLGCDQAQGYLFSRPVPPSAVAGVIANPDW